MVVLKIEPWIARFLMRQFDPEANIPEGELYRVDISSKNPRWRRGQ
jgi:hypothetical protein